MVWKYSSPIGDFFIKRMPDGSYCTEFDGTILDCCNNPQALADNVYVQSTGCLKWDRLDTTWVHVPRSLDDWEVE